MNSRNSNLDAAFLEQQRRRLLELRTQLQNAIRDGETEESEINGGSLPEAREAEEDAQRLAQLEVDGTLIGGSLNRLAQVDRALQKLDEGTYGLSDVTGAPIPRARLIALPEAIAAVDEQTRA